ncbi:MAG: ComF family protein [Acidobacteriota bacterium]|nr:MAG: ComF family protein [Acidobacteriota bacterium]
MERYSDTPACRTCWQETHIISGSDLLCARCGVHYGPRETADEVYCRKCDDHHYDRAFAVGLYEKALAVSVVHLKEIPKVFSTLSREIENALGRTPLRDIDLIVPVPLSQKRRHERGFNQAELIAGVCSKFLRMPVDAVSLQRIIDTPMHRSGMDAKARAASVEGAFGVARPKLISGAKILLVDDVLTSGATASGCAEVLKNNGACSVTVFTLARAVLSDL